MLTIPSGAAFLSSLLVTPEELNQKASDALLEIQQVMSHFEQLEQIEKKTGYYWEGEAGEAFRSSFQEKKMRMDQIIQNFKQDAEILKQMSQVYAQTEQQLEEISNELPGDLIE